MGLGPESHLQHTNIQCLNYGIIVSVRMGRSKSNCYYYLGLPFESLWCDSGSYSWTLCLYWSGSSWRCDPHKLTLNYRVVLAYKSFNLSTVVSERLKLSILMNRMDFESILEGWAWPMRTLISCGIFRKIGGQKDISAYSSFGWKLLVFCLCYS